jgi:aspartokinase
MKFGGSALGNKENIERTCQIVKTYNNKDRIIIIVSAMKGVTDKLYEIADKLKKRKTYSAIHDCGEIEKLHYSTLKFITCG